VDRDARGFLAERDWQDRDDGWLFINFRNGRRFGAMRIWALVQEAGVAAGIDSKVWNRPRLPADAGRGLALVWFAADPPLQCQLLLRIVALLHRLFAWPTRCAVRRGYPHHIE
jgi:hypothetical protein